MKVSGVGSACDWHSAENPCRFPDARTPFCHQCGKDTEQTVPVGLEKAVTFCSPDCEKAWDTEHPDYWIPVEETLPGGRYDGVWENSGLRLGGSNE